NAFQLTNFLRDVNEDLDRGRVYIPQVDVRRFGVDLAARRCTPEFVALMKFEIERCRELYASADKGIAMLPARSARCIRAARTLYSRILERIEAQQYDVFAKRASVPTSVGADSAEGLDGGSVALARRWVMSFGTRVTSLRQQVTSFRPRLALGAFIAMVAGMIATPLFDQGGDERRALAHVVVAALFVSAVSAAAHDHGQRALVAAASIVVVTFAVEILGSKTGFPFGEYDYTGALTPQLFGVPIVVSFAWAGITLTVHGALRNVRRGRIALMACAITAWDAFLDPQMVGEGYWQWEPSSPAYRGIPLVNYLGWLLTASITSAIAVLVCKSKHALEARTLIAGAGSKSTTSPLP
ncbi:MAG: carotenoid biosynthesis protein, partial [Acidimicrobiia bacterium]|nr:carotenoid biosynthesis protein [Acidimicrobiia bacterium]